MICSNYTVQKANKNNEIITNRLIKLECPINPIENSKLMKCNCILSSAYHEPMRETVHEWKSQKLVTFLHSQKNMKIK